MITQLKNIQPSASRSVGFRIADFAVPIKKSRRYLRHRIYGAYNQGFVTSAKKLGAWNNFATERAFVNTSEQIDWSRTFAYSIGGRFFESRDTDRSVIHFSTPFETDFDGCDGLSGSFQLEESLGGCRGLASFDGRLLIICDYGFATLEPTYNAEQFRIRILARIMNFIIQESACVIGRDIYFATEQGICRLRRGEIELLDIPMDINLDTSFQARVFSNRYVLRLRTGHAVVIDTLTSSYLYLTQNPGSGARIWESEEFTLGYSTNCQFLKQIQLRTTGNITVIAKAGTREQRIQVQGGDGIRRINLNVKGESFKIRIEAGEAAEVSDLMVVVGFGRYIWR